MPLNETARISWLERSHDMLVVALVVLRPLIWSGDATASDNLGYLCLVLLALGCWGAQIWLGQRSIFSWNWGGLLFAALWLLLLPAAARSVSPSLAWGFWGMLGIHLGLAAYLMQVMAGRERLVFSAVVSGLVILGVIGLMQHHWVLPHMTQALENGDESLRSMETGHGDLAERLRNGGVFATFTIANNFSAYLLLTLIPLAGTLFVSSRPLVRLVTAVAIVVILLCAMCTGAKGALAASLVAGSLVCLASSRRWWRWLLVVVVIALVVVAMSPGRLHHALAASAKVRLGYWQGAEQLIGQSPLLGHGLGTFAQESLHVMPLWAEPTSYVHNEVLEGWVDAGILCALILALLLVRLAWVGVRIWPAPQDLSRTVSACAPLVLLVPLFCVLGTLDDSIAWLPGGQQPYDWAAWVLALTALAIICILLARNLPAPPAWAWRWAVGAFALHCLIDFDLHCPGLWGMLVIIGCLCAHQPRTFTLTTAHLLVGNMLIVALAVGLVFGCRRALDLAHAQYVLDDVDALRRTLEDKTPDMARFDRALQRLAHTLSDDPTFRVDSTQTPRLVTNALDQATAIAERWPRCAGLALKAAKLRPPGEERLTVSLALCQQQPDNPAPYELMTQDLVAVGHWQDAIAALQQAITLAPASLANRNELVRLYGRAAKALPSQAAQFRQEAEAQHQQVLDLMQIVNPRNMP